MIPKVYLDNVRQLQDVDYTIDRIKNMLMWCFQKFSDNKSILKKTVANKNQRSLIRLNNFEKIP